MRAVFDSHLHVIDPGFPLVANHGFVPAPYSVADYLGDLRDLEIEPVGGVVVSGSFQAEDTAYLVPALGALGPSWRAVVNLAPGLDDGAIRRLHDIGVRALRVNLRRGARNQLDGLEAAARRVWDLCGWHVEFYLDAADLPDLGPVLARLPKIAVDHLGLSEAGLPHLLPLVARGAAVKASGFSRFAGDPVTALRRIDAENPGALMLGSDLPSTRAPGRFGPEDLALLDDIFGGTARRRIEVTNGAAFYGVALDARAGTRA